MPHSGEQTPGDSKQAWGLAKVLAQAIKKNPVLEQASLDVVVAEAQVLTASGVNDFVLGANIVYQNQQPPGASAGIAPESREGTASLFLSRSFATGTLVELNVGATYLENNFNVSGGQVELYTGQASLSLTQPLLRGRGSKASRSQLLQAIQQRDISAMSRNAAASSVVRQVISAYWELSYAVRELDVRKDSLRLAEDRLSLTSKKISTGLVPAAEGLAVEQVIARRKAEVLAAEVRVAEQAVELGRLAGLELGTDTLSLRPSDQLVAVPHSVDREEVLAEVLQNNLSLLVVQAEIGNAELRVAFAATEKRPRLDLQVQAGAMGVSEDLEQTLRQVGRAAGYSVSAQLTFQQPLQNRTRRGGYRVARQELHRAHSRVEQQRALVVADALQAVQQMQAAKVRIELERKAIQLSEKNIETERVRFDLGKSTNFDVLMRQDEWGAAQLRHARAVTDYLTRFGGY